ncbi:MAG: SLC13 family permease [Hyphomicrobiales bacterium]|nr:SLC13 family permease [Hyphomicrobiales bacterium]
MIPVVADNMHMWITFAVIAGAIVLFVFDNIPIELSALVTVVALLLAFHLFPVIDDTGRNSLDATALLAGFANPVLFAILALLVVGQGMFQTGAVEKTAEVIGSLVHLAPRYALALTLLLAAIISAFLNNTPVVVIFIPVLSALATRLGMTAGNILMPLSFITILGGMTTLIGSSANLIAAAVSERTGGPVIGFFDFAVPGLFLASIGAVYVLFIMPRIISRNVVPKKPRRGRSGKQFIAQINISEGDPWIGATSRAGLFPDLEDMTIRLVQRGHERYLPPFDGLTLQQDDIVTVSATRSVLSDVVKDHMALLGMGFDEREVETNENEKSGEVTIREPLIMSEAVIAPGSTLIGRTVAQAQIQVVTGCTVVAIERRSRMLRTPLDDIQLRQGDVILLVGTTRAIRKLGDNRNVLLLARSRAELPLAHHATRAAIIFLVMISLVISGLVPIAIAAMLGAIVMILGGCLTLPQAARAFDRKIFLLVGTAFALAVAMQETGGAKFLAHAVVEAVAGYGPAVLLSALFLLTALLTNFLSNHATAALVVPIAVSAAIETGVDPTPFVYGMIFALNCSFATPIAYQTNLIVMGPGHYRFKDFMIAGMPLILLLWLAYSLFAPIYFNL